MQTGTTILFIRAQKSHCNFRLGGLNLSPPVRWAVHPTPLAHAVAWGFMGGVHATERWPSGLQSAPPTFPEPLHPCWVLPYLILRGMSSRSGSSVAPPPLFRWLQRVLPPRARCARTPVVRLVCQWVALGGSKGHTPKTPAQKCLVEFLSADGTRAASYTVPVRGDRGVRSHGTAPHRGAPPASGSPRVRHTHDC